MVRENTKTIILKILISLAVIIFIAIFGWIIKDMITMEVVASNSRFESLGFDSTGAIYYDKQTKVQYISYKNGRGGTALTVLVDKDGKPLLYEESEE